MLSLFLFEPNKMYSGGAVGIAAASLADAKRIAKEYNELETLVPILDRYCLEKREFVPQAAAVPGVHVEGEPRIVFDYIYEE